MTEKDKCARTANRALIHRLGLARQRFHQLKLKKTGKNRHYGFTYFELGDFLIPAMECLFDQGLVPVVTFDRESAYLTVHDIYNPRETLTITSPMVGAQYEKESTDDRGVIKRFTANQGASLAGCHPIQNMGAVETYQRRYLWVTLMEIVEHDQLDASTGTPDNDKRKTPPKKKAAAKKKVVSKKAVDQQPQPKAAPDPSNEQQEPEPENQLEVDTTQIEDEQGAMEVADLLNDLAVMHSNSIDSLKDFWARNKQVLRYLKDNYPEAFTHVKNHFSELKSQFNQKGKSNE